MQPAKPTGRFPARAPKLQSMPWQLLLQMRWIHLKLALGLIVFGTIALGAGLGALCAGWKGAVLLPLGLLLLLTLTVHLAIKLTLTMGLRAFKRGNPSLALKLLWLTQLPPLRRYDRTGLGASAFARCQQQMAGQFLQNIARSFLS